MIDEKHQLLLDLARLAYFADTKRKLTNVESTEWIALRFKLSTPKVHQHLHEMFFQLGCYGVNK